MKIYSWSADPDGFGNLCLDNPSQDVLLRTMAAPALANRWQNLGVHHAPNEDGTYSPLGDCPQLRPNVRVLSARARDVLAGALVDGETLALDVCNTDQRFVLFNCTRVLDAFDEDRGHVQLLSTSPRRFSAIKRFAFKKSVLNRIGIFKIPQNDYYYFVGDDFVNAVSSAHLGGFRFAFVADTQD